MNLSSRCSEKNRDLLTPEKSGVIAIHSLPEMRSVGSTQAGFTLIELMISLTLGLLVTAAATQLLFTGVATSRLQQAGSDLQDNGLFGLEYMAKDIRLANFGNSLNRLLTDQTAFGGIVLTADTCPLVPSNLTNLPLVRKSNVATTCLTTADKTNLTLSNVGPTNITAATGTSGSDQLTIQFQAPGPMSDCEGAGVLEGERVVQRYFVREEAPVGQSPKNLVLACDAARITPPAAPVVTGLQVITGLGGTGQIIMNRVDYLKFKFGVQTATGRMAYYSIPQYMALAAIPKPRILSVQVAALVRSTENTANTAVNPSSAYEILGQNVTPIATSTPDKNRYVREVYQTTVALRNAMGAAS